MKAFYKIAITCILICLVFTFTACGLVQTATSKSGETSNTDTAEAEPSSTEAETSTTLPRTPRDAFLKMESYGYSCSIDTINEYKMTDYYLAGITHTVTAYLANEELIAFFFEDESYAKTQYSLLRFEDDDKFEENIEEGEIISYATERHGRWIVHGTAAAVNVFVNREMPKAKGYLILNRNVTLPITLEGARSKMEKVGYEVTVEDIDADMAKLMGADGAKQALEAYKEADKEEDFEYITAVLFDSSKNAKAYYNDNKDNLKKMADAEDNYAFGQSGKWVYAGTEAAVKAFLG